MYGASLECKSGYCSRIKCDRNELDKLTFCSVLSDQICQEEMFAAMSLSVDLLEEIK